MKPLTLFLLLLCGFPKLILGQRLVADQKVGEDSIGIVSSSLLPTVAPLLLFDEEKVKEKKKESKKNARKSTYFGIKTRKGSTRRSLRGQEYTEFFHFTDASWTSNPYVRDRYWYDPKDRAIRNQGYTKGLGYLLHGPYQRLINQVVVESGMFFYGTKHQTWLLFDANNILQDKTHFEEGWPKESRITYYNSTSKAIEKLIPVQYGLEEGNFFHFYPNQQIAVTGEYRFGQKVGLWTEYWNTNNTKTIRKREIQYQEKPYTKNFRPYIRAEWDKEGNLIYRKNL
uniref:toxin-antitoxin system YwqK family antitoxin n=1 Tax=Algoriphagus sp. TaxID=1872435 RepID=UPI004048C63A